MKRDIDIFRHEETINTKKKTRQRRRHNSKDHMKNSIMAEFYLSPLINTVKLVTFFSILAILILNIVNSYLAPPTH